MTGQTFCWGFCCFEMQKLPTGFLTGRGYWSGLCGSSSRVSLCYTSLCSFCFFVKTKVACKQDCRVEWEWGFKICRILPNTWAIYKQHFTLGIEFRALGLLSTPSALLTFKEGIPRTFWETEINTKLWAALEFSMWVFCHLLERDQQALKAEKQRSWCSCGSSASPPCPTPKAQQKNKALKS